MTEAFKIAIVGAGPGGLSAAAHAANLGVAHVLLEASPHAADTIFKYQKRKHVMSEPAVLPLRSPMSFGAGPRERILETWDTELAKHKVNIRYGSEVKAIAGSSGAFVLTLADGQEVNAEAVVLGIGLQGNLRKLGVAGDDLPRVQYQLADPDEYEGETIVVVGAGDAGIENALALMAANRVIMINRAMEFARCRESNLQMILAAIEQGKMECVYGATPTAVAGVEGDTQPLRLTLETPKGLEVLACDRIIGRLGAIPPRKLVESFGVAFPNNDPAAVPQLTATYESNVPGIYIVGALGGYPLIKQGMNQGYEVVETILRRAVEPADEPLLKSKFARYAAARTVAQTLDHVQAQVPLLALITSLQLREFMLDSSVHMPAAGEVVFRRNDYTNSFYVIVEGEVEVEIASSTQASRRITLKAGEFFGELGLISGRRRAATVTAGPRCVLIETPRRAMLKLVASVDAVRRAMDRAGLRRAVLAYLSQDLAAVDLDALIEGASVKSFASGETLFAEGAAADGLYLLRRGSVTVSRLIGGREIVLSYVPAGNVVGEMALLSNQPRMATVRAAVATEAIVLDGARFQELIARDAALRAKLQDLMMQRMRANVAMESQTESGNIISYLMKQGLGEATDVLLIDESLCIRCNQCEKACSETHGGTSRLRREAGPTYAQVHVPTSCRHCEHPHCMKECPPDAIHRAPNGEVYIADTCIGCGNCERNCPYGVIQMAVVDKTRRPASLITWLLFGLGPEPGEAIAKAEPGAQKKAVKCDMCKDLKGGAACVRACPTGAALRVTPDRFLEYASAPREMF